VIPEISTGNRAIDSLMKLFPQVSAFFMGKPSTSVPGTDNAVDPVTGEAYDSRSNPISGTDTAVDPITSEAYSPEVSTDTFAPEEDLFAAKGGIVRQVYTLGGLVNGIRTFQAARYAEGGTVEHTGALTSEYTEDSTGKPVKGTLGSVFAKGGPVRLAAGGLLEWLGFTKKADGGLISGAGTGTRDSIPRAIPEGDHIMPAAQTKTWLPVLEAIRKGQAHMAMGGQLVSAMVSHGEYQMPAAQTKTWLPVLEAMRGGTITRTLMDGGLVDLLRAPERLVKLAQGGLADLYDGMPTEMPTFALGGIMPESVHSIAIPSVVPVRYAAGGMVQVTDGGASAVTTGNNGPSTMQVMLHPEAMNSSMRDWLENEVARQQGRR
jgi:hypothetical protein